MRRTIPLAALVLTCAIALPLSAAFLTIPQPDIAYTSSTNLLPVNGIELSNISSITDGILTASFSSQLQVATVPGNWLNWGSAPEVENATPRVLITPGVDATLLTITFSQGLSVFGLEAAPDAFGPSVMTANFFNGATNLGSIQLSPDGSIGARLFAASSSTPITSIDITAVGTDFAIGDLRYAVAAAAVPEPGTWIGLASGLVLFGLSRRRKLGQ